MGIEFQERLSYLEIELLRLGFETSFSLVKLDTHGISVTKGIYPRLLLEIVDIDLLKPRTILTKRNKE